MKALTCLCTAKRPISSGIHSNCKNSLTVSIYTRSISLFCWKHLCLMSHVLNTSLVIYCVLFFLLRKNQTLIIDTCDRLLCVEIADIKTGRKASQRTSSMCFIFRLLIGSVLIQTKYNTHFLSSFIVVNNFLPLYFCYCYFYCYYCCRSYYCSCCLIICFPFSLLFLQVTLTTKVPLNFTVTIQSHTRPLTQSAISSVTSVL